jgi:hypothetical protein
VSVFRNGVSTGAFFAPFYIPASGIVGLSPAGIRVGTTVVNA